MEVLLYREAELRIVTDRDYTYREAYCNRNGFQQVMSEKVIPFLKDTKIREFPIRVMSMCGIRGQICTKNVVIIDKFLDSFIRGLEDNIRLESDQIEKLRKTLHNIRSASFWRRLRFLLVRRII